ncbi:MULTISPECIES: TetR/AcrR family transcriptional regulator [unclassified Campylobacter]|uniref:TetR/AcrR family transcriptional regulator n=1 Tax=unclassified Campylobacter TaxID=2593542 RepID=UPI003D3577A1
MAISKKGKKRYEAVIEAAHELFLQNGYEKTSLNQIVSKSGGSLASVYKFFENKEKLFAIILEREVEKFQAEVDEISGLKQSTDLSDFLNKFGLVYLEIFYKPESAKFLRIIISETYKNKELGKLTADLFTNSTINFLSTFFKKPEISNKLKEFDPQILAFNFCALIREPFFMQTLILGEEPDPISKKEKKQIVADIVEMFLKGVCK